MRSSNMITLEVLELQVQSEEFLNYLRWVESIMMIRFVRCVRHSVTFGWELYSNKITMYNNIKLAMHKYCIIMPHSVIAIISIISGFASNI